MNDGPDRFALVHQVEGFIDARERLRVGDERRELDLALHGVFHHAGQLRAALYAAEGRACLLQRNYTRLNQLVDANFDLRAKIYQIDPGNLEMVYMARAAGATANFAGSGGAIVGTYDDEPMFARLTAAGKSIGVAVIKPKIVS